MVGWSGGGGGGGGGGRVVFYGYNNQPGLINMLEDQAFTNQAEEAELTCYV